MRNIFKLIKIAILTIKRINMILKMLIGKIVVFDFDGTMDEFYYNKETKSLLPCKDKDVYEYSKTHNIYNDARMLESVKFIINNLNNKNVFVLTRTEETLIDKKNEVILKNFNILPENIIHVQKAENKLEELSKLHDRFKTNIIFVEDTFKTILNAEETFKFVKGIHISSFIA